MSDMRDEFGIEADDNLIGFVISRSQHSTSPLFLDKAGMIEDLLLSHVEVKEAAVHADGQSITIGLTGDMYGIDDLVKIYTECVDLIHRLFTAVPTLNE